MINSTSIKCDRCGETDKFATITKPYRLADPDLRGQTLIGYRCLSCGATESLPPPLVPMLLQTLAATGLSCDSGWRVEWDVNGETKVIVDGGSCFGPHWTAKTERCIGTIYLTQEAAAKAIEKANERLFGRIF